MVLEERLCLKIHIVDYYNSNNGFGGWRDKEQVDYYFRNIFKNTDYRPEPNIKEADVVLFTGGEDINPGLYRKGIHMTTIFNSQRDKQEVAMFDIAQSYGAFCIGICRGAQLLCALSGGSLFQDVSDHTRSHRMTFERDKSQYIVSSTHHQMMNPYHLPVEDYELIGYAKLGGKVESDVRGVPAMIKGVNVSLNPKFKNPEIVYFKKTKSFAMQLHPEIMSNSEENQEFFEKLESLIVEKYLQDIEKYTPIESMNYINKFVLNEA